MSRLLTENELQRRRAAANKYVALPLEERREFAAGFGLTPHEFYHWVQRYGDKNGKENPYISEMREKRARADYHKEFGKNAPLPDYLKKAEDRNAAPAITWWFNNIRMSDFFRSAIFYLRDRDGRTASFSVPTDFKVGNFSERMRKDIRKQTRQALAEWGMTAEDKDIDRLAAAIWR